MEINELLFQTHSSKSKLLKLSIWWIKAKSSKQLGCAEKSGKQFKQTKEIKKVKENFFEAYRIWKLIAEP